MSIVSNLIQGVLKRTNAKKFVYHAFKNPPRNTGAMDRDKFSRKADLLPWIVEGFELLSINQTSPKGKHLIFFPGGAYVLEANPFHRRFMEKLASDYGLAVTFMDYPKSPENTYRTTLDVVTKSYHEIVKRFPGNDFFIMGDSAGGGLGLALLQVLRDQGITPFPKKTVLISPWLDLSLSNKEIPEYESRDCLLSVEGLIYTGKYYSGGEDLKNPLLSPIYGDLGSLGDILLIFGSNEVFYPDCVDLAEKISVSPGSTIETIIGENMMHDWIIFPFKESKIGIDQIAQFILSN